MNLENMRLLQLFADGAVTGETAAAAGQPLPEIPAEKPQHLRANTWAASPSATAEQEGEEPVQPDAAAEKPTWEELMADPEYNRRMQQTVQARLKSARAAEETLGRLSPALQVLMRRHGLDPENPDYDALARCICGEQPPSDGAPAFARHIRSLEQQGAALRRVFPDFDLRRELQDPVFVRLTAPGSGLTVEDAYFAVHRAQLMEAAARKTARRLSNSVQAGYLRPRENSAAAQAASVTAFDYRSATPQQRAELKRQIRAAAARGEKLYPR